MNTHDLTSLSLFYLARMFFYSLSKFQLYNTVLSAVVIMLYVRASELIHLLDESLYSLTNVSLFLTSPTLATDKHFLNFYIYEYDFPFFFFLWMWRISVAIWVFRLVDIRDCPKFGSCQKVLAIWFYFVYGKWFWTGPNIAGPLVWTKCYMDVWGRAKCPAKGIFSFFFFWSSLFHLS